MYHYQITGYMHPGHMFALLCMHRFQVNCLPTHPFITYTLNLVVSGASGSEYCYQGTEWEIQNDGGKIIATLTGED